MAKWHVQSQGCHGSWRQPPKGSCIGRIRQTANAVCRDGNNQSCRDFHHAPIPLSVTANPLAEGACHIEHLASLEHVVARPGQLVGHRFLGDQDVAFRLLALVVALDRRAPDRPIVRSLHKGPGQVLVAVFLVALTFTFAIADFLGFHAAGIGGVVPWTGKALDGAGLQCNGCSQYRADARYALQQLVILAGLDLSLQFLLNPA